ncbi:ABC transporter ATP-binding protein [Rhodobacteraceae bacterium B1Z28]|uniref:ABC transporter ATP-binding protein n=1 Tax=Ruegeria haliotis TaxID=2747601 RepID=A0ABX2PS67_9RHOB|nr:ABC transporter ATP-binding protein [Ruegeria haliotis]NVO57015.1 ABC transporter ATP-binding protein [Ruegeria haliotis]
MTTLTLEHVWKRFGSFEALKDINLNLPSGKMITFLGPSGSGKSTMFRLVAGLDDTTEGTVRFDGEDVTRLPAHKRNVGMVFQNYALFPHLNVWENISYGLKLQKRPKAERRARAEELLDLIKLPHIADRSIKQLSGGQQQRVSIARALAMEPRLFLLDEPLSALDAKLREHMQAELCDLQQTLGITTIVVTHDQREAMTMSDVVVVIDQGEVQQVGSPLEIYRKPATPFVADFVGSSTLLEGIARSDGTFEFNGQSLKVTAPDWASRDLTPGLLCLRPEQLHLAPRSAQTPNAIDVDVSLIRDLGSEIEVQARAGEYEFLVKESSGQPLGYGVGDKMRLHIPETAHLIRA